VHTRPGASTGSRSARARSLWALCALSLIVGVARAEGGAARPLAHTRTSTPAVGLLTMRLIEPHRLVRLPGGRTVPRTLVTLVRYPALGRAAPADRPGATPARSAGPYPLVVFGHGFAVTPTIYARLLHVWAEAGYVVAAPVFPLENANAPGGPNESDLVNQPADMTFVISRLLAASAAPAGPLHGLIDATRIAVAGQSDGGETALAVAYDRPFRDRRVRAAVILSGSQLPGGDFTFPAGGPPLLATQGTADTVNPPSLTNAFYAAAPRPKFLLTLIGAAHLPPYTDEQPQLGVVERVTIGFLDHYLEGKPVQPLLAAGAVPGVARLTAEP
jgi:dienelactone hydrolase